MTTEVCVDKTRVSISQKGFLLMDARLAKYPKSSIVHLDQTTRTGNYLTKAHYLTMLGVWIQWKKKYGRPSKIFTTEPYITDAMSQPVASKPQLILDLQTALGGSINNLYDWINLLIKVGVYSHYNCKVYMADAMLSKYGLKVAIQRIRNGGLNCADYVALTIRVLDALIKMGLKISYKVKHVDCNNSKGEPNPEAGHFILEVTIDGVTEDCDPAEAASGKRGMPHNMCYYNYKKVVGNTLC